MSWTKGMRIRTACNRLRIDANDGSPVVEYRIENGGVERRTIATPAGDTNALKECWEQLTPAQVVSHILASSAVAYWLHQRMGAQALFQVCGRQPSFVTDEWLDFCDRNREVVVGEFSPLQAIPAR